MNSGGAVTLACLILRTYYSIINEQDRDVRHAGKDACVPREDHGLLSEDCHTTRIAGRTS